MLQEYNSSHKVWFAEADSPLWLPVSNKQTEKTKRLPTPAYCKKQEGFLLPRKGVSHQMFAFAMERWGQKVLPKKELLPPHTSIQRSLHVSMTPQATYFRFCMSWILGFPLEPKDVAQLQTQRYRLLQVTLFFLPVFVVCLFRKKAALPVINAGSGCMRKS